jgi:DNA-binding LacI/PurR family transcriptional regulator
MPVTRVNKRLSKRPTITDVARLCDVTPATVSRVLNGKTPFSASKPVRQKIFNTAAKLGYVPDLAARNLNRRATRIIGLFASPQTHVAGGINESLFEGIAEVLRAGGYDVFYEVGAATQENPLPFWRFDGAILMQAPRPETVLELDRRRVPYVCVNEKVGTPAAFVLADDRMGTNRALEHLAQLGHKRIGYANARATYFSHYSVTERYETLLTGVRTRGIHLVPGHDVPLSSAQEFLQQAVIEGQATAVITYDHHIAVMLVGAAHGLGLKIPDDFSLICFNDVFPVALLPPPLTAVAVSGLEMGRVGADLLLNNLLTPDAKKNKEIRIPEDLVVRASTAPPPSAKSASSNGKRLLNETTSATDGVGNSK